MYSHIIVLFYKLVNNIPGCPDDFVNIFACANEFFIFSLECNEWINGKTLYLFINLAMRVA